MSKKFEYVGKAARYCGKSLPQICLKLKDFGIGRMFQQTELKRYPQASYFILTKFEANMNDEFMRDGVFEGRYIFRGSDYGIKPLPGWLEDFKLVPKDEEKLLIEQTLPAGKRWREPTIVPRFVNLPPLLKELLKQEAIDKNIKFNESELKLPYIIKKFEDSNLTKYEDE